MFSEKFEFLSFTKMMMKGNKEIVWWGSRVSYVGVQRDKRKLGDGFAER